jgi:tetratricopeptide (TPR) repeat protein
LYSDIARAIAEGIRVKLSPADLARRRPIDPEAYQLYLKGRYYWNKATADGLLKGIEYFQQAIDKDPSFALAYSWLANCYSVLGVNYRPANETFPKGRAAALKALELDSTVTEPHVSIAAVQIFYDWDWTGAGYHLDRAIALGPSYAFAHGLKALHSELMGRPDEAMAEITRAQELDPLALIVTVDVGVRHYFARRYDRAIEQYQGLLGIDPNATLASYWLWLAYEQQGDYGKALAQFRRLMPAVAGSETEGSRQGPLARESYMAALREELPKLQVLRDRRTISAGDIAAIHTLLGETDLAFEWLEKAYRDRDSRLPWVKLDPRFDALRADARFEGLLRRMDLRP